MSVPILKPAYYEETSVAASIQCTVLVGDHNKDSSTVQAEVCVVSPRPPAHRETKLFLHYLNLNF